MQQAKALGTVQTDPGKMLNPAGSGSTDIVRFFDKPRARFIPSTGEKCKIKIGR